MLVKKVTLDEFSNEMHKEWGNAYTYEGIKALHLHLMAVGGSEIMDCNDIGSSWTECKSEELIIAKFDEYNGVTSLGQLALLTQVIIVGENHILAEF